MNAQEKMLEIIKKKQSGGKAKQMDTPKNDRKNMRKGPKIYNKQVGCEINRVGWTFTVISAFYQHDELLKLS